MVKAALSDFLKEMEVSDWKRILPETEFFPDPDYQRVCELLLGGRRSFCLELTRILIRIVRWSLVFDKKDPSPQQNTRSVRIEDEIAIDIVGAAYAL